MAGLLKVKRLVRGAWASPSPEVFKNEHDDHLSGRGWLSPTLRRGRRWTERPLKVFASSALTAWYVNADNSRKPAVLTQPDPRSSWPVAAIAARKRPLVAARGKRASQGGSDQEGQGQWYSQLFFWHLNEPWGNVAR